MSPIIDHLTHYADQMLKSMPAHVARPYLKRCVIMTRDEYGERVAKDLAAFIGQKGRGEE